VICRGAAPTPGTPRKCYGPGCLGGGHPEREVEGVGQEKSIGEETPNQLRVGSESIAAAERESCSQTAGGRSKGV